jgi:hypothetical protein
MHPDDPAFNAMPSMPVLIGVSDGAPGPAKERDDEADFDEDV